MGGTRAIGGDGVASVVSVADAARSSASASACWYDAEYGHESRVGNRSAPTARASAADSAAAERRAGNEYVDATAADGATTRVARLGRLCRTTRFAAAARR